MSDTREMAWREVALLMCEEEKIDFSIFPSSPSPLLPLLLLLLLLAKSSSSSFISAERYDLTAAGSDGPTTTATKA